MRQRNNGHSKSGQGGGDTTGTPPDHTEKPLDEAIAAVKSGEVPHDAVILLAEEDFQLAKRLVETGRVRVHRTTVERTEHVDVPLSTHSVEVRRVPVGKRIKKMPAARATDDEFIIPVVEEVVVVERHLMLREEIHIRRVESLHRHTEEVTLRIQEATVERVAPPDSGAGPPRAARSEGPARKSRSAKQTKTKKKGVIGDHTKP